MKSVIIFDTTLRDGEQCPGGALTPLQKLEIARNLAGLGVDVIEAGFPISNSSDFDAVDKIAREVKGPIIAALARCVEKDIEKAASAIKGAKEKGRIHVFVATSKIHRELKLKKSQQEIIELAAKGVEFAKRFVSDIEFSPEDASRTEPEFLIKVCKEAIRAGATTINIPDTVGWVIPEQFKKLIGQIYNSIDEVKEGKVVLSVHCHNDLGLAVANSIAALEAGATQVECTINGIGERAGNAALEEIVMILKTRRDLFSNLECRVNTRKILEVSRLVSMFTGFYVPRNKAIVGENAFAHASGIHQDGIIKSTDTYQIIDPRLVGLKESQLPLTRHSGRAALERRLHQLNIVLSDQELDSFFERFKEIASRKKFVYDEDLRVLASDSSKIKTPERWSLVDFKVVIINRNFLEAVIALSGRPKNCRKTRVYKEVSSGDGPIDAIVKAINKITKVEGKVIDYSLRSLTQGEDAQGEVILKATFGTGEETFICKACSTDIIEASIFAYLNAVNSYFALKQRHK